MVQFSEQIKKKQETEQFFKDVKLPLT